MDAVIECGYSIELDYFEFMDIENDSLLENSAYKYGIDEFAFQGCTNFNRGFNMNRTGFRESEGRLFHDGDINFSLDLGIGGLRKDLPECVLEEIKREANRLLEVNFVKEEDIKKVKFTCYAKIQLSHYFHHDNTIKCGKPQGNNHHVFYRHYSIHIEIEKISDYYNEFDLDDKDIDKLKYSHFCLCDIPELEKPFDDFIRDEIFH